VQKTRHSIYSLLITQNRQEVEEDLDDINVDCERSKHVFFLRQLVLSSSNEQLCIVHQEHTEDQHSKSPVDHLKNSAVEEDHEEAKAEEDQEDGEDVGTLAGEIDLRLASKQRETERDDAG